ncbi:MAG: nickel-dependent lactate racemase [Bacteroidia bacterium]|nr:nickel-dependent lactate racemase [Bacteroidia bacterium]
MKIIPIEYGSGHLKVAVPDQTEIAGMKHSPAPLTGAVAIPAALDNPLDSPSLSALAVQKLAENSLSKAVIVVSDHTRPVPYRGENGLIPNILRALIRGGFKETAITVLIGAGSHRNMEPDEIEKMLGLKESGFSKVSVVNHEYDVPEQLTYLGKTRMGSVVMINRLYMGAELKIVTGLVESHFMAGASGGRKGVCPGIVGKETLNIFHGARFLSSAQAADMILDGNPLHDEALEIAQMAGCDFLVNVTIDNEKRITGVFAGNLQTAHQAAVQKIRSYVMVPLPHLYDIVVIPAGFVGVNHYQAAKAAIEAARAVKPGGQMVLVARHTDPDPIGGAGYKEAIRLLHATGRQNFTSMILTPGWKLIQEQWQVQMWCKVFEILGKEENLLYCALEIPEKEYEYLPGTPCVSMLSAAEKANSKTSMRIMIEKAIEYACLKSGKNSPSILLLKDGPYGIPEVVS